MVNGVTTIWRTLAIAPRVNSVAQSATRQSGCKPCPAGDGPLDHTTRGCTFACLGIGDTGQEAHQTSHQAMRQGDGEEARRPEERGDLERRRASRREASRRGRGHHRPWEALQVMREVRSLGSHAARSVSSSTSVVKSGKAWLTSGQSFRGMIPRDFQTRTTPGGLRIAAAKAPGPPLSSMS